MHRNTPKADLEADALRHAEQKLKSALPMLGMFGKADPAKLQAAIDQAKEAGVSAAKLADAEAALEKATAAASKAGAKAKKAGGAILSAAAPALAGASSLTSLTFPGATAKELEEAKGRLRAAFDRYDTNQSGKLDHKELLPALKKMGVQADTNEAVRLLHAYSSPKPQPQASTLTLTLTLTLTPVLSPNPDPSPSPQP